MSSVENVPMKSFMTASIVVIDIKKNILADIVFLVSSFDIVM